MNNQIINQFNITASGNKIFFQSDEKTANDIRLALVLDSDFWEDIQRDFGSFPVVKTTIYLKGTANIDKFLEIGSVRKIFIKK